MAVIRVKTFEATSRIQIEDDMNLFMEGILPVNVLSFVITFAGTSRYFGYLTYYVP